MALPPEMQSQVDMQAAIENNRAAHQANSELRRFKLEALKIAKDLIIENRRSKTAAEVTDISDSDVTSFAESLTAFVNS